MHVNAELSRAAEATAELNDLRRRLRWAERQLACFRKAFGHELPNQLVAFQGLLQVFIQDERDRFSPESQLYLDRVAETAQRTHALVRVLAEISRAGCGAGPLPAASLAEAALEAAAEINKVSPGRVIVCRFPEAMPLLAVAHPELRQVIVPLLGRAARRAGDKRPVRIEIGAHETDAGLELWIADDGAPLSTQELEMLFEPFSSSGTAAAEGLKMFLARQIVDNWGGTIRAAAESGRGNRITVLIPEHLSRAVAGRS